MADYYPLISKAVAGLDKNSGEARRSLYERARTALVQQLRSVTPALSESDITRERLALEEAIRKVEAEAARKIRNETPRTEPPRTEPPRAEPPARPEPRTESRPQAQERPPERPSERPAALERPPAGPPERPAPPPVSGPPPRADAPSSSTASELRRRPLRERPLFDKPTLSDEGLKGFRDVVAEAENLGEATAQAGKTAREAYAAVPAPSPEFERIEPHIEPEGLRGRGRRPGLFDAEPSPEPEAPPPDYPVGLEMRGQDFAPPGAFGRGREYGTPDAGPPRETSPLREPAVRPDARSDARGIDAHADDFTGDDSSHYVDRMHAGSAMEADPERPSQRAQPRGGQSEGLRGVRRMGGLSNLVNLAVLAVFALVVGGLIAWQWQPIKAALGGLTSMFASAPAPTPREAAPARQKIADRVGDPRTSSGAPVAAVAQKVVLYEEDPSDPAGKQYVGSAVWRSETVSPGPGQPPDTVVRADIEIPDRKMTVKWSLRRNSDKALPASHTIEIIFTLSSDFAHGGVQNIPGILMKQAEQTRGVPLAGLAVKVTNNFFLIGLSAVESDMQRNVQLLRERSWFDVPVVYNDGRRAILAVEKGTPGERTFNDAFAAWTQR